MMAAADSAAPSPGAAERAAILHANLVAAQQKIERACERVDRDPAGVHLIAVTKTFPSSDIRTLAELGLRDFGENRDQEARRKCEAAAYWPMAAEVRWHFIGQLQTNKAASVARYATLVHCVDRPELITALAKAAHRAQRTLGCLLQVQLDEAAPPGRGGALPAQLFELAAAVCESNYLHLAGVMAVAPRRQDPAAAFVRLATIHEDLLITYPNATIRSAGMSGDFAAAIAQGATHLRLGAMILGERAHLR